ncbi:unnamed protein product [Gongylonema pulchrum]|uniref:Uncharacterized protein n=1 Tax=Gongylonema pulchrum TaxID=637853 RepID=A0A183D4R5_9BILA|nr:unnamed protein product [Gongylonema pulchrum]
MASLGMHWPLGRGLLQKRAEVAKVAVTAAVYNKLQQVTLGFLSVNIHQILCQILLLAVDLVASREHILLSSGIFCFGILLYESSGNICKPNLHSQWLEERRAAA